MFSLKSIFWKQKTRKWLFSKKQFSEKISHHTKHTQNPQRTCWVMIFFIAHSIADGEWPKIRCFPSMEEDRSTTIEYQITLISQPTIMSQKTVLPVIPPVAPTVPRYADNTYQGYLQCSKSISRLGTMLNSRGVKSRDGAWKMLRCKTAHTENGLVSNSVHTNFTCHNLTVAVIICNFKR